MSRDLFYAFCETSCPFHSLEQRVIGEFGYNVNYWLADIKTKSCTCSITWGDQQYNVGVNYDYYYTAIQVNFNNTPVFEPIKPDILLLKHKTEDICDQLIYHNKYNRLHKFLASILICAYKKENPQDQPFWNTDCSRLNYIIR